ncbi:ankyrin repeat-containing domain protein [Tuber indicum]|nr:ankyrin repeat-containing domain protein [Tuber indicum]
MLLERGDVNPDQPDTKSARTPLAWAALGGHEGVVKKLLERGDVNPDHLDTKYGRTPLAWAAMRGYARVVNMLLERRDVSTATLDNQNQTPQSRALSNGHHRVVKMLVEYDLVNSPTSDRAGSKSPPASSGHGECAVPLRFMCHGLDTCITDVIDQHSPQSPEPDDREPLSNRKDALSKYTDSDLPPAAKSRLSQPPPMWPLRRRADPHPDNTRSTFSLPLDRYFAIASFLCLFAFLVSILLRYLK